MSKFAGRLRVVWVAGGLLGVCVSALAQVPESVTPLAAPDVLVPMPSKADVPLHTVLPAAQAEARRLFGRDPKLAAATEKDYVTPWSAGRAEKQFLARFKALLG